MGFSSVLILSIAFQYAAQDITSLVEDGPGWPVAAPGPDGAYGDCQCVRRSISSIEWVNTDTRDDELGYGSVICSVVHTDQCFSHDYGVRRCSAWDAVGLAADYCDDNLCNAKWCYVDPNNCTRKFTKSSLFPGLAYSYHTCGNVDWRQELHNFSSPIYAWIPWTPNAENALYMKRTLRFAWDTLETAGIAPTQLRYRTTLSNASRRASNSSSYTACVHDIALGHLDLCLGDFWDTEPRRSLGVMFSGSVGVEKLILLGAEIEDTESFAEILEKPFLAFDWNLWALVFITILVASLGILIFEFHQDGSDFEIKSCCKSVWKSCYLSALSFVNAGVSFSAVTTSGRILSLGYGFFLLLCIASFTAETASILIQKKFSKSISSLSDALNAHSKVCYPAGLRTAVQNRYPTMKTYGVSMDSFDGGEFVDAIKANRCAYAIIGDLWLEASWAKNKHCEFSFIGNTIFSLPVGYYASDVLFPVISWAVVKTRSTGLWKKIEKEMPERDSCIGGRRLNGGERRLKASKALSAGAASNNADGSANSDGDAPKRLNNKDMTGPFLIVGACFIVAVIYRCCQIWFLGGISEQEREIAGEVLGSMHKIKSLATEFERLKICTERLHKTIERHHSHSNFKDEASANHISM